MDYSMLNDQEIKALLMQYDSEMRKLSFQMQVIQSTIQKLHESLNSSKSEIQQSVPLVVQKEIKTENFESVPAPKIVSGIEYPKKRAPKIDLELKNENKQPQLNVEIKKESKKRGRKPKNSATNASEVKVSFQKVNKTEVEPELKKEHKKRGRKPKNVENLEVKVPKKRGPKSKTKTAITKTKRKYTKDNPWPEFVISTLSKYGHLMNSTQLYELADEENNLKQYGYELKEVKAMLSRAFHYLSNVKKNLVSFEIKGSRNNNYGLSGWMTEEGVISEKYIP